MQQGEPDSRLNPGWLAKILDTDERELLCALAYAVRDGLVDLHWEVYCPVCGHFFGGAVNTAARVQSLSHGNDVMVTDAVIGDVEAKLASSPSEFYVAGKFDAELRGLPAPVHVHRLIALEVKDCIVVN